MPVFSLFDQTAVLPLKGIIFQTLLLLVAIVLEAIVLRQRLRLGFQPSIRYAATINLLTVVLGWIVFLEAEQWLPIAVRTQIISYVMFGNFYVNSLSGSLGVAVVIAGLVTFFLTFWVKVVTLEWLTWSVGTPIVQRDPTSNVSRFRHRRSPTQPTSPHVLAVLQANALSFSAVLVLLLLRYGLSQRL
ncbi:MAG: filament integrity protein FraC [Leptolyngbyaceae cyanobacterium]